MIQSTLTDRTAMPEFDAPDYALARLVIARGLALVYLIAFVVAIRQFAAPCGERGLDPAPRFLAPVRFLDAPSLFDWGYSWFRHHLPRPLHRLEQPCT